MKFRSILGIGCMGASVVIFGIWLLAGSGQNQHRSFQLPKRAFPGAGVDSRDRNGISEAGPAPAWSRESVGSGGVPRRQPSKSTKQDIPLSMEQLVSEKEMEARKSAKGQGQEGSDAESGMDVVIVQMPAAYINPDPSLVLEQEQIQAIQAIRKSFGDAMNRAGNPSSPEYLDRWLAEQARADELLMAYLGQEAFSKFHQPETE